jgi:hypothetical protein
MTICLIPNCSAALEKVDSGLYAAAGESFARRCAGCSS